MNLIADVPPIVVVAHLVVLAGLIGHTTTVHIRRALLLREQRREEPVPMDLSNRYPLLPETL